MPVPLFVRMHMPHDRLFIAAFDGTWNDAERDDVPTSVGEISAALSALEAATGHRIHVEYVEGIGTQDNFVQRPFDGAFVLHTSLVRKAMPPRSPSAAVCPVGLRDRGRRRAPQPVPVDQHHRPGAEHRRPVSRRHHRWAAGQRRGWCPPERIVGARRQSDDRLPQLAQRRAVAAEATRTAGAGAQCRASVRRRPVRVVSNQCV